METTFSKLWNTLKPIEAWSYTLDFSQQGDIAKNQWTNGPRGRGTNIRLDTVVPEYLNPDQQIWSVWQQVRAELIDLITFADLNHVNDAFYKSIDGEVKRGKLVDEVRISSCTLYREYKPKNHTYEFVVYMVLETVYND